MPASPARKKSPYSEHPAVAMEKSAIATLKSKSGRTLEEWIAAIKKRGGKTREDHVAWLKKEGFGTNYADWLADQAGGETFDYDPEALVEAMFAGKKAALRPIYEKLLGLGLRLGKDVTATPCATMVPLRRRYVFAQLKPATLTRIDLGLALGDTKAPKRLIPTGGLEKGDRITHRIPIGAVDDIDAEVVKWLKTAYQRDQ